MSGEARRCGRCGAPVGDVDDLMAHANREHSAALWRFFGGGRDGGEWPCGQCGRAFETVDARNEHVADVHQDALRAFLAEWPGREVPAHA